MLLTNIKSISKRTTNALAKRGILTVDDLLRTIPRKYMDYTKIRNLEESVGSHAAIKGFFESSEIRDTKNDKLKMFKIQITETSGTPCKILTFTSVKGAYFLLHKYGDLVGKSVVVCGKVSFDQRYGYSMDMDGGLYEEWNFSPRIQTVYTHIGGVSDGTLRSLIDEYLRTAPEPLEKEIRQEERLPNRETALRYLHHPSPDTEKAVREIRIGKSRLLFDDLLYFSMELQKLHQKADGLQVRAPIMKKMGKAKAYLKSLPFELTSGQKEVLNTMAVEAAKGERIDALIQGDVGSGKTLVALTMMLIAAESGYQSVLIAPRAVLAKQHYTTIQKAAEASGFTCVFLSASVSAKEKKETLKKIRDGEANLIVGTHSCLSESVTYHNLGLTVTDEEHLFGVKQKEALQKKAEMGIHQISMSATPIPRTLTDILYGESKEILIIHGMPEGRKPIKTSATADHMWLFPFVQKEIESGHQCYVVCPAINGNDTDDGLVNVEDTAKLYHRFFTPKGIGVGVVNGKMKPAEIAETMERFSSKKDQILISTTVIEVGVNVPDATVMIVEQADRFGLASLHQLRGRVGRSSLQSYCFLVSEDPHNPRLQTMCATNDGFKIAEEDMKQRGGGNLIGEEQSGMNYYLGLAMRYPKLFDHVKETAKQCLKKGYGNRLVEIVQEGQENDAG